MKNYLELFIDDVRLDEFLFYYLKIDYIKNLISAWSSFLNDRNEQDYIWRVIYIQDNNEITIPILLCPDDLDLSCTVIVAKVKFNDCTVEWNKVGIVNHNKDYYKTIDWKKSGIRDYESWTAEDWERFGEQFNLYDIWDDGWEKWIMNNETEEYRRRTMNYTHKFINNDKNISWFTKVPKMVFNIKEYKKCIESFRVELKSND